MSERDGEHRQRPELGAIRGALDRAGFTEPAVLDRLAVPDLPAFRRRAGALPQFLWRTRAGSPLDVLIRLLLLRRTVPTAEARAATAPVPLESWAAAGLLTETPAGVTAAVELTPCQGLVLAADWPRPPGSGPEPVMGLAASTRALARMTVRRRVNDVLDLGTGCGLLALLAAAHADRVTATDLNPEAVRVARFNAALNGTSNIACLQGDLFEPVRDRAFDLVVCNPPFVIAPGRGWLHTHSGRPADDLCRDILRGAAGRLREGGFAQMLCNCAHIGGRDAADRLAEWVRGTDCDAWVLRSHTEDVATYAWNRIGELTEDPGAAAALFEEWMAYYARERIEAVSFVVVTLRRAGGGPNWFRCDPLPEATAAGGPAIERRFAAADFLRDHPDDGQLLSAHLRPAPDVRWDVQHTLSGTGWAPGVSRLRVPSGLAVPLETDPGLAAFVAGCGADRPLGEHLRQLAVAMGQPVERLAPGFLRVVRRLVELGVLVPVGPGGPA